MPTDLISRAEQYRRIADTLRHLANEAVEHRSKLLDIAEGLEALADDVEKTQ